MKKSARSGAGSGGDDSFADAVDFAELLQRSVGARITPPLEDESKVIGAFNKALRDVTPQIRCFCIPGVKESRLFLCYLDPSLVVDLGHLRTILRGLMGDGDAPEIQGVHAQQIKSIAKSLLTPGLKKGDQDIRHSVSFGGGTYTPSLNQTPSSQPDLPASSETMEVAFPGNYVNVPGRRIGVYIGGALKEAVVIAGPHEEDSDATVLLSGLLRLVDGISVPAQRRNGVLTVRSDDLRRALAAKLGDAWVASLNLPSSRQASLPV